MMKIEGLPGREDAVLNLIGLFRKVDREDQVQVVKENLQKIAQQDGTDSCSGDLEYPRELSPIERTDYLVSRGFSDKTCRQFSARYDKETWRVVIPVLNLQGQVVNYVMRLTKGVGPKYRYISGVPKHGMLFGLGAFHHGEREVVIVEGPLDVMWVWQAGIQVLGLMGSRLDQEQVNILHYLGVRQVTLHLDNDKAGYQGTLYAHRLLQGKFAVNVAGYFHPNQDPCNLSKSELRYVYRHAISVRELEEERSS